LNFLEIQTCTGWGRALQGFADWCRPQPGWLTLDVGCGPGLLPALFSGRGCRAFGVDLDLLSLMQGLHPALAQAGALHLPFPDETFHLVTASNLLFFLPDPGRALCEMARLVRADGCVDLLNPSERMSVAAAAAFADQRGLTGLDRDSLMDWAQRAEENRRWDEADLAALFAASGLVLQETALKLGPGLARFVRGRRS
jgi:ubiquinone/menaquinone biosynthesis C-methylase UbiE